MFSPGTGRLSPLNRRVVTILGAWIVLALVVGAARAAEPAMTVRLVIDYGDGVETHYKAIAWRDEMTVLDALEAAKTHRHSLAFGHRGSGRSTMITKIGDLANEGGGAKSRNWLYSVNEKPADVGAGVYELKPGDAVLWKFQVYDYNSGK